MKKQLKSLFKVSLVLVTLGTIMMIVGVLFGGVGELSREVSELVRVVRTGVIQTVERIPMLESITNINGFTFVVDIDKDEVSVQINEEYETIVGDYSNLKLAKAEEVENLDISIMNGSCKILPSENGCFGVKSICAEQYQCYVSEGTLYLSAFPKDSTQTEGAEIILYVPAECEYKKVFLFCSGEQVRVESGLKGERLNVSSICGVNNILGSMDFTEITVTAGIGKATLSSLSADTLKMEVGTAEVFLDGMNVDMLEINLGMGRIYTKGTTSGDIILNCGMGELEMFLAGEQSAYNYDISGSAESVQIGTDILAGMVMERWIDNGSDKKIAMNCAMGSVKIEFEQ